MTKQSVIKSIDSIIGKLVHLNANIEGNQLQQSIREIARIRDRLMVKDLKVKK